METFYRNPPKINLPKPPVSSSQPTTTVMEDPFGVFETKEATDLESFFSMGKPARTTSKQPTAASAVSTFVKFLGQLIFISEKLIISCIL